METWNDTKSFFMTIIVSHNPRIVGDTFIKITTERQEMIDIIWINLIISVSLVDSMLHK